MCAQLSSLGHAAGAGGKDASETMSSFAQHVYALLDRTEYRRCESGEDFESIYRLRYNSYRMNDLVPENASRQVHDEFDELPNCHTFGIYIEGRLVSTMRLHDVSADNATSPALSVYKDLLMPRLAAGEVFIDPSRFAVDAEWSRLYPQIPYVTLRLAGMACFHFGAPYCISMIREDHAAFYKRVYRARPIGDARPYAGVINCFALLYQADVLAIKNETYARFPFFRSTPMEQRMLFDKPGAGELAPLTILPTAKYFREAA
ncbi:hypothetical protein [Mesorhizobium sp. M0204]|uniref:N-acyl amino acid synthase FeeM domain-containing protein n=1 Tax=unclassified Mesorhizobium TaxID=325217 RepID=UPI0033389E42